MNEEYIELRIRKHIAKKICFASKLFILILIPYLILAIQFEWWEWWQDWIAPSFGEIHMIFFISLCSIIYIRLLYSNKIIRKVYLLIPLFLTFFSAPIILIVQHRILIDPQYHDILLWVLRDSIIEFIVSSICSVLYVHHLKTKKKTIIGNTDNQ